VRRKKGNQNSLVGIANGYMLEGRGSNPGEARYFSVLQIVQTGSGAQPPSYEKGTGDLSPGGKAAGSWT
jgi:hypothetical protein